MINFQNGICPQFDVLTPNWAQRKYHSSSRAKKGHKPPTVWQRGPLVKYVHGCIAVTRLWLLFRSMIPYVNLETALKLFPSTVFFPSITIPSPLSSQSSFHTIFSTSLPSISISHNFVLGSVTCFWWNRQDLLQKNIQDFLPFHNRTIFHQPIHL